MPGTLYVVATPIGNLEDITFRAVRILREVDLVAAEDTRRTAVLLRHHHVETPLTSFHDHNERQKLPPLVERLRSGASIALVSDAGTPAISDPGYRLVRACLDASIRVSPIPGPSALISALVVSGLPTQAFTFVGYPPARSNARKQWLSALKTKTETIIFFEAPHRIRRVLSDALIIFGDRPICVARELTKVYETLIAGPISEVVERLRDPRGELTVVVSGSHTGSVGLDGLPDSEAMLLEIGHMTEYCGLSRRQAARRVGQKYGLSPNAVYSRTEKSRK